MATFNSRFSIGDVVYLLVNNVIKKDNVKSISFTAWKSDGKPIQETSAHYGLYKHSSHPGIAEPLIHESVDDLLKSLKIDVR